MKQSALAVKYLRPNLILLQRGAAVVELAIVLVLLTLLAAGIFEFSRAFWYYNALDKATRDPARYLSALTAAEFSNSASLSAAITLAKTMAVNASCGAGMKLPDGSCALTTANVEVTCDGSACSSSSKPDHVTVRIINYSVKIGANLPFVGVVGDNYGDVSLHPSTSMQYMN
ncbi:MAG: pilus assembly protein [Burkholderiales bacterium]|nr:pilus assembly protein [Burkholderiales bacterium]